MPKQFRIFGTIINDDSYRDSIDDVTPSQFNAFLRTLPPGEELEIAINSPGGHVTAGLAIANMVKSAQQKITCRVYGIAASMASVIACAAPDLRMFRSSFMMIHNPWGIMIGNATALRKEADVLDSMRDACVDIYASKFPTLNKDDLSQLMENETWMLGTELSAFGLACGVEDDPAEMAACVHGPLIFAKIPDPAKKFYSGMSAAPAADLRPPTSDVAALSARAEALAADLAAALARASELQEAVASRDLLVQQAQAAADSAEAQRRDHQSRADRVQSEFEAFRTQAAADLAGRDGTIQSLQTDKQTLETRVSAMTLNALQTPKHAAATTWEEALAKCGSYEAAKAQYPHLAEAYRLAHPSKE